MRLKSSQNRGMLYLSCKAQPCASDDKPGCLYKYNEGVPAAYWYTEAGAKGDEKAKDLEFEDTI